MKKYIYNANQFSQLRQLDICTSDLGILSDPGSAKNPTVPSCQQKYARHFGSFSQMWKLKKKCLQPNHHLSLFHEAPKILLEKKHFQTPSRRFEFHQTPAGSWFTRNPTKHASFDCWNTTSRKFIACRVQLSWEFFCFPLQNHSQGVKIFDPNSCKKREAGLHSLSESPLHEWIWTQTNRIPCCTSR